MKKIRFNLDKSNIMLDHVEEAQNRRVPINNNGKIHGQADTTD